MDLLFKNKKITGILTIVPKKEVYFEDEMANFNFSPAKSKKLALVMGYKKHRIAEETQTSADLCIFGLNYLLTRGLLVKDSIDAIIFVSQTPDYQIPPTSNLIQAALDLNTNVICLDINQGCAGFEIGLIQAFLMLEQPSINKVVLLNADVLSHKVSKYDRNSWPLIGDAASITIIESSNESTTIPMTVNMDGKGAFAISIPAGGARMPHSHETAIMEEDDSGNIRSMDNMIMKGDDVFNFAMREVPPMINHILKTNNINKEDIDWFLFHQPNKFMLCKIAEAIEIPLEKLPTNIVENFGNASGVTVPMNICYNLKDKASQNSTKICIAGFGVGLTWSSAIMNLGPLNFCEIIEM